MKCGSTNTHAEFLQIFSVLSLSSNSGGSLLLDLGGLSFRGSLSLGGSGSLLCSLLGFFLFLGGPLAREKLASAQRITNYIKHPLLLMQKTLV
jgi:hypothetical protein